MARFSGYVTIKTLNASPHRSSLPCPRRKTSREGTIRGSHIVKEEVWSLQAEEAHIEMPCDMHQRALWSHWKVTAVGTEKQKGGKRTKIKLKSEGRGRKDFHIWL